jgi:subtilisin family serine protease
MIKIIVKPGVCIRLFCFLFFIFLFSACTSENDSTTTKKTTTTTTSQNLTAYQWHLVNTGQTAFSSTVGTAGMDINQSTTYNSGNKGDGVTVAVIDTGMELAHEDLSPNVISGGSWDFVSGDTDPTNNTDNDGDHGTSVAGLIAAADNGLGGRGVAAEAELKGFNFMENITTQNFTDSIGGSSSSPNSIDVDIFNMSFGYINTDDFTVNTTIEDQFEDGINNLRSGKGAIYVKSAGNGFESYGSASCTSATGIEVSCQNSNMDPESALPYIIVVGATNADGEKSSYSTAGSNLLISAPGGEYGYDSTLGWSSATPNFDEPAMITTDQSGCNQGYSNTFQSAENKLEDNSNGLNPNCNYTATFNGTSSAAPVLSGAIALVLKENSDLSWRDVRHILITTAQEIPATANHGGVTVNLTTGGSYTVADTWVTNSAGHEFHNWYGFGQLDVDAAVTAAGAYILNSLGTFTETPWTANTGIDDSTIEDDDTDGGEDTITFGTTLTIETVQIKISVTHAYTGDLGIELTSPAGTRSILLNARNGFSWSDNLLNMILTSNAFYGEASNGDWTVKVVDAAAGTAGTLDSWSLRVFGH